MTKQELEQYIVNSIYQNNERSITGRVAQDAFLTVVDNCYGTAPEYSLATNTIPKWNVVDKTFISSGVTASSHPEGFVMLNPLDASGLRLNNYDSSNYLSLGMGESSLFGDGTVRVTGEKLYLQGDSIFINNILFTPGGEGNLYWANDGTFKPIQLPFTIQQEALLKWDDFNKAIVDARVDLYYEPSDLALRMTAREDDALEFISYNNYLGFYANFIQLGTNPNCGSVSIGRSIEDGEYPQRLYFQGKPHDLDGDGTMFWANDGTFKPISQGGGVPSITNYHIPIPVQGGWVDSNVIINKEVNNLPTLRGQTGTSSTSNFTGLVLAGNSSLHRIILNNGITIQGSSNPVNVIASNANVNLSGNNILLNNVNSNTFIRNGFNYSTDVNINANNANILGSNSASLGIGIDDTITITETSIDIRSNNGDINLTTKESQGKKVYYNGKELLTAPTEAGTWVYQINNRESKWIDITNLLEGSFK